MRFTFLLPALGCVLTCTESIRAQIEFNPALGWEWSREIAPGGIRGDGERFAGATRNGPQQRLDVLYRPRTSFGFGVRLTARELTTAIDPAEGTFDFDGVRAQYIGIAPAVSYRPALWLSFDAAAGRTFATSPTPTGFDDIMAFDLIDPTEVEAPDYTFAEAGVTLAAGVATLRLGYFRSFAAERAGLAASRITRAEGFHEGFSATLGLRVGTAHRRYGRPVSADSLLVRSFGSVERKHPRWRGMIEANFFAGRPLADPFPVRDDVVGGRVRLAASYRASDTWRLRALAGWRRSAVAGTEIIGVDRRHYGTTRTHEIELGGGAERVLWREFAVGLDLTLATPVERSWRASSRRDEGEELPARADQAAPVATTLLLGSPYLRYYVGERLTFDARGELTLSNPYGGGLDRRLDPPAERSARFATWGAGFSYALVR